MAPGDLFMWYRLPNKTTRGFPLPAWPAHWVAGSLVEDF